MILTRFLKQVLWWACLFVAPLILLSIELFHPAGFTSTPGAYQYLSQAEQYMPQHQALSYFGPTWWFNLHMVQTPMVGLVSVGLLLIISTVAPTDQPIAKILARLAVFATFIFVIYYTVLDAIGGIGLGRTIVATQSLAAQGKLTPEQVQGVALVLNTVWTDPFVGGVGSFISMTPSWAVFFAALFAAAALFIARRAPWPPLILLIAFGWELQTSHAMPHGPIAFGLLIITGVWLWIARERKPALATQTAEPVAA